MDKSLGFSKEKIKIIEEILGDKFKGKVLDIIIKKLNIHAIGMYIFTL